MIYYLAIAVFGYLGYKTWEEELNVIIIHGFYNLTKTYHIVNDYLCVETIEDNKPEEKKIEKTLLEIVNCKQNIYELPITEEELEKIKKNTLILKVNDNYKILKDTDYENINKIDEIKLEKDKLFLQVTYNDNNNNEVEIHNKIKFFAVEGNEILSKKFLLWFMKQYYNIDIQDDYRIGIIDNDVNMFDIKNFMSIKIKKNTYSLESE
jgi:hypothetical protein